jgi:hypothetical protein
LARTRLTCDGDSGVVHHELRVAHQLIPVLDVARVPRKRMHDPEFRQRELDPPAPPLRAEALEIELERSALEALLDRLFFLERVHASKQSPDPRHQVRQAHALRQVIVGPEPQSRNHVENPSRVR